MHILFPSAPKPPGGRQGPKTKNILKTFQVEQEIKFVASRQEIHLNYKNK